MNLKLSIILEYEYSSKRKGHQGSWNESQAALSIRRYSAITDLVR